MHLYGKKEESGDIWDQKGKSAFVELEGEREAASTLPREEGKSISLSWQPAKKLESG